MPALGMSGFDLNRRPAGGVVPAIHRIGAIGMSGDNPQCRPAGGVP